MSSATGEATAEAAASSTATDNMIDPSQLSLQQLQNVYQQLQKVCCIPIPRLWHSTCLIKKGNTRDHFRPSFESEKSDIKLPFMPYILIVSSLSTDCCIMQDVNSLSENFRSLKMAQNRFMNSKQATHLFSERQQGIDMSHAAKKFYRGTYVHGVSSFASLILQVTKF
eukprot:gb/GECG01012944.1/.p1 GENE.gb/GECG01012944.1/~~gb/GECG01012944.1/.p1  ORF type:complete len:168 (+),score=20.28 gb/GECG01012944.1/:1-504(+)